jgi:succinoglycan biosynthesis transport protein ExoP
MIKRKISDGTADLGSAASDGYLARQELTSFPGREQSVADYWRVLQKRKWTIISAMVIVVTVAGVFMLRMTPRYDAVARISIAEQRSNPLNFKDNQDEASGNQQESIDTQIKIMQSDTMAELVIQKLGLDRRPLFAGAAITETSGGIAISGSSAQDRAREDSLIHKLQANLKVQQVPGTSIIEIKLSSPDPSLAAEMANAVTSNFIEQNIKARYESTMRAADWLSKQLADLQIKVQTSQTALLTYQKETGL